MEALAQSIAERVIGLVVGTVDVNALLDEVDLNAVMDRIDLDRLLDWVDLEAILDTAKPNPSRGIPQAQSAHDGTDQSAPAARSLLPCAYLLLTRRPPAGA